MTEKQKRLIDNLTYVRERIAAASERSGRKADDVTLVAVTKYVGPDEVRQLVDAGCLDIGESRPQVLWRKAEQLNDPSIRWHLVGHLQRNKTRRCVPLVSLLHSGDSVRLLETVNEASNDHASTTRVLLEVNVSGDATKHGFTPDQVESHRDRLAELKHLQIQGLMTMASLHGGPEQARRDFERLRLLRDQMQQNAPSGMSFDELSMGMSNDFEVAIEEGATIVRVGSLLFDGLEPGQ